jgi:hypothetical protein
MTAEPGPRPGVDDLGAAGSELFHSRLDIADGDADVVHPRASTGQKAPDVRVGGERRDELDPARAEAQVYGLDALLLQPVAHLHLGAEERSVRLHRRVEVLDGKGDVVHRAHVHTADPNDWAEDSGGMRQRGGRELFALVAAYPRMMSTKQLASLAIVSALAVVAVVATIDATRSRGADSRQDDRQATASQEDAGEREAAGVETVPEDVRGVLYYSDREDDCRVLALRLPSLEEAPLPHVRACRFEPSTEPGTGAFEAAARRRPPGRYAAACRRGRVEGCAPSWKPDGTLTLIRGGELWSAPCVRPAENRRRECGRKLLSTDDLTGAAHAVQFVPTGPRHLRSVAAIRVAWLGERRSAVLVRVRLRGRLRAVGPVTVLALYDGRRLLRATQYAGAFDLRLSPRRSFLGVLDASGEVAIVTRSGRQLMGPGDLPSPATHAVAWSPDERWTAVATRWSVFLLPTSDLEEGRRPRIIRLPLAVGDLAWR